MLPLSPKPVSATYDPVARAGRVTFSQEFVLQALNVGNWTVRFANNTHDAATAAVDPENLNQVFLTFLAFSAPDAGPNGFTFDPPPFDLIGAETGQVARAFQDFPYVLV